MNNPSNHDDPTRSHQRLVMSAAELMSRTFTWAEVCQSSEASYRRGVHHGVVLGSDLADESDTLKEARRTLRRAERLAGKYRDMKRYKGQPPLLCEMRRKLAVSARRVKRRA
jgi:hypothetical protein